MIKPTVIEDIVEKNFKPDLLKVFSLVKSNYIPAICVSGKDKSFLDFFIRVFLTTYEEKKYKNICNSNDFFEIESNSQLIKIDDIRKLVRFSSLKKEQLKHKYTIIRNLEYTNIYAQNSLLKMIEEPGIDTLFLCTSCAYSSLINTIKSRLFKISIQNKPIQEFDSFFCEEIRWLASYSFETLLDFSQLSKPQQKQVIINIRNKSLYEVVYDYIKTFNDDDFKLDNGIILKNRSLKQLNALIFFEKLVKDIINNSSKELQQLVFEFKSLIHKKSLHGKGSNTDFNNTFFKDLFLITERVIYIILSFQEGALIGALSYTNLTTLCIKHRLILDKKKLCHYITFLEKIKNLNHISLNSELIMINYLNLTRKLIRKRV